MKPFKSILLIAFVITGGAVSGQNKIQKPIFEEQGEIIKGRFYYEDGSVRQEGTYKNGKLHGEWISYNTSGEKTAIAEYKNGAKDGKWFFWSADKLTEVDYNNNAITSVKSEEISSSIVKNDD